MNNFALKKINTSSPAGAFITGAILSILFCFAMIALSMKIGKIKLTKDVSSKAAAPETVVADIPQQKEKEKPATQTIPVIQVSPTKPIGDKITAIRTLSKEFDFESSVDFIPGEIASKERLTSESYKASYNLTIHEPQPALSLEDVCHTSESLQSQLPDLNILLDSATVNPYWHKLYRLKKQRTVDNAHHLLKLLTKHNYYDCKTILNLKHPRSKRHILLVQSDMDVVTDGSDGDRMPVMPEEVTTSTHYQPTTSYSWAKQTNNPNPMIAGFEKRINNANIELRDRTTSSERAQWLKNRKKSLQTGISEMKKRSFLIAEHDPFIVLPVPIIVAKDTYAPNVGDYAVVFYEDKAYPAIVGDAGPTYKMGEASLRIARQLNPKASPYNRAVSDLSVTYVVFPGSRKKPHRAPDYDDIYQECQTLLNEIGGLASPDILHKWENTLPLPQEESSAVEDIISDPLLR